MILFYLSREVLFFRVIDHPSQHPQGESPMFVVRRQPNETLSVFSTADDAIVRPLCAENCGLFAFFSGGSFTAPVLSKLLYRKERVGRVISATKCVFTSVFCDEFLFKIHSHTGSIITRWFGFLELGRIIG